MAWKLNAMETRLRRQHRVDGVGRPKFDFHTDSHWPVEDPTARYVMRTAGLARAMKMEPTSQKYLDGFVVPEPAWV